MTNESVVEDSHESSHAGTHHRLLIATLVAFALLSIKGIWIACVRGPAELVLDAAEYWRLSGTVVGGDIWMMGEPIAYRTPGYPWFLAFMRMCLGDGSRYAIMLIQLGLHIGSVGLMGCLVARMTRKPVVLPVTLMLAIPATSAFVMDTSVLTEPLFVFAMSVHLWSVWKFVQGPSLPISIAAGFTLGILCLIRPIAMYIWPAHLLLFAICLTPRVRSLPGNEESAIALPSLKKTLSFTAVAAVTFVATLSPWLARNHAIFGNAFLTQFTGRNLWIPTFQDGSGAALPFPDTESGRELRDRAAGGKQSLFDADDWRHTWTVSHSLRDAGVPDDELDRLMQAVAIDAIAAQPTPVIYKTIRRSVNFWRTPVTHLPLPDAPFVGSLANRWVDARLSKSVGFNSLMLIVTLIVVVVLLMADDTRYVAVWLACIMLYFNAVTAVLEIPDYRYRMILEPIQMALAAAAMTLVFERFRGRAVLKES
ncbi:MAG: hypothetical protein AAF664_11120 [Planctomycetota bacterium]